MMDSWPALGNPVLVFSGGEPLMRPDIFELMEEAGRRGIPFALSTNGTLVDEAMARRIAACKPHRVSVSLDGADAATHDDFRQEKGAFDRTLGAIRHLRAQGVPMQINTSVTTHNRSQLPEILELAIREDCVAWHVFMLVPVGCGLQIPDEKRLPAAEYERILAWFVKAQSEKQLEMKATCAPHVTRLATQFMTRTHTAAHPSAEHGKGCLAGRGICFISRFGQVQGCGYLPVAAGDLRKDSLEQVWNDSPFFAQMREPKSLQGKCGVCEYASSCMGCRARAYSATGNAFAEEPLCAYVPLALRGIEVSHG